ncbi:hypothetical protein C8F04DRAFT_346897 [Mycena alexandri]|uniref:Uncharacterized protein n=1 Tax=Mycena alexandri TaxID=1745969 RepID=A0AAD6T7B2_9AGAR|nr:hypothetical protein C8F04DRAFT_1272001 [Mycena alexandri]KAJ7038667.1 hypothetical protein C8F04DRAFT_346897 [Mycena alexandri]
MAASSHTDESPLPASESELPPHIAQIAAAGDALNATLPSHTRSMEGQTPASFARTTPSQADGAGAVPPVIDDDESQNLNTVKAKGKKKKPVKSASQSSVAGEGEKGGARKGSYVYVVECLNKAMVKVDKLTTGMTMRINSVTSTAESAAHEIATLRDKVAHLERKIDDLRWERADGDGTGSESGGASAGGQKRKAGSSAGSRTPKRARRTSRGRSSRRSSRFRSQDRGSRSRSSRHESGGRGSSASRSRSPRQHQGRWEEERRSGREETEDDEGHLDEEVASPGGGRPLVERLEKERAEAKALFGIPS